MENMSNRIEKKDNNLEAFTNAFLDELATINNELAATLQQLTGQMQESTDTNKPIPGRFILEAAKIEGNEEALNRIVKTFLNLSQQFQEDIPLFSDSEPLNYYTNKGESINHVDE